jgi:hypothetical protein
MKVVGINFKSKMKVIRETSECGHREREADHNNNKHCEHPETLKKIKVGSRICGKTFPYFCPLQECTGNMVHFNQVKHT